MTKTGELLSADLDPVLERALAASAATDRCVLIVDGSLAISAVNEWFCKAAGRKTADVTGSTLGQLTTVAAGAGNEITTVDDDDAVAAALRGAPVQVRLLLATAGGSRLLPASFTQLPAAAAGDQQVLVTAEDITDSELALTEASGITAAVDRGEAVIEFSLDGKVFTANKNFLDAMGYQLPEIVGKHHRLFCTADHAGSEDYARFWQALGAGQVEAGEYKRLAKGGREVWLQATYNPILDVTDKVMKVVKFATDITATKQRNAEYVGKVNAVDRAQAVIEFSLDGRIQAANKNFLDVMGYTEKEVLGKHHRIFCDPAADFWVRLGLGEFEAGEYKRLANGGREVWLQATYNPIMDVDGNVVKILKFASDVTDAKLASVEVDGKRNAVQRAQAVIEFDLDGLVLSANENFQRAFGYSQREVLGQHHSTFFTEDYARSEEYRDFWLRLGKGEFITGRFHRIGKFGREVHIQAAYNPIMDPSGAVIKVVKFAYDITAQVEREQRIAAKTLDMTTNVTSLSGSSPSPRSTPRSARTRAPPSPP